MDAEHPVIEVFGVRWRLDASGLDPEVRHNLTHLWRRAIVEDDGVTEVETFRVGPGHPPPHGAVSAPPHRRRAIRRGGDARGRYRIVRGARREDRASGRYAGRG